MHTFASKKWAQQLFIFNEYDKVIDGKKSRAARGTYFEGAWRAPLSTMISVPCCANYRHTGCSDINATQLANLTSKPFVTINDGIIAEYYLIIAQMCIFSREHVFVDVFYL